MRCWPTSGPGRSWWRSSASTPGRSFADCRQQSLPRTPGWTCRRRPRRPRPGSCRRRWCRSVRCLSAGRPSWRGYGPPGRRPPTATAGWCLWPAARASARPGWPPNSPDRSTPRAGGCCTGAAPRQHTTRCSRSRRRWRTLPHPCRTWLAPAGRRPPWVRDSPTCWPAAPIARCCWSWTTCTRRRHRRWRHWLVLRPRPPRGGCWCWAPTATRRPRSSLPLLLSSWIPAVRAPTAGPVGAG
jgi:hypothetical protein